MQNEYNFSILIPHKNTPDLLRKCIASIPHRDDVQIIVVDDNSDPAIVDFDHFPGLDDPFVEVYLTKEGRGAGYAKNVGLPHVKGKWLMLIGADDYFHDNASDVFDQCLDNDADVIYFKLDAYNVVTGEKCDRGTSITEAIDEGLSTGDFTPLILQSADGGRFVRTSIIFENGLRWNEVMWGNDVVFSARLAVMVKKVTAFDVYLHCLGVAPFNLTKARSLESQVCRLEQECIEVGITKKKYSSYNQIFQWLFYCWMSVYKINRRVAFRYLPKAIKAGGFKFISIAIKAKFFS